MSQLVDDLRGDITGATYAGVNALGLYYGHVHVEVLAPARDAAVFFLMVAAEINTHDLAIVDRFDQSADSIGKISGVHLSRATSLAFREDGDGVVLF